MKWKIFGFTYARVRCKITHSEASNIVKGIIPCGLHFYCSVETETIKYFPYITKREQDIVYILSIDWIRCASFSNLIYKIP